jgi:urease accessory protein UreF
MNWYGHKEITMNFEELYKPYATKDAPDITGQIKWLQKEVPQHIVDQAMLLVYTEISNGKTFEADEKHTATWHLWMYLQAVARELHKKELEVYVKHLETFHSTLSDKIDVEWKTLTKWQKIKQVLKGLA